MIKNHQHIIIVSNADGKTLVPQWDRFAKTLTEHVRKELKAIIFIHYSSVNNIDPAKEVDEWLTSISSLQVPVCLVTDDVEMEIVSKKFHFYSRVAELADNDLENIPAAWIELFQSRAANLIKTITSVVDKSRELTFEESALLEGKIFSELLWGQWEAQK